MKVSRAELLYMNMSMYKSIIAVLMVPTRAPQVKKSYFY